MPEVRRLVNRAGIKIDRRFPYRIKLMVGMVSCLIAAAASQAQADLPLSGPASALADAAFYAYARGDYALSAQRAREALRLRPDVAPLKLLLKKAETARGAKRVATAQARAPSPRPDLGGSTMPAVAPSQADPAYIAADAGYRSYDRGDFSTAVGYAQEAVRLAPTNREYWSLLVNALSAANRLTEATAAINQGIEQAGDDGKLSALRDGISRRITDARAYELGTSAYKSYDEKNYTQAALSIKQALQITPKNRDYQRLLVNALFRSEQFVEAEQAATSSLADNADDAALLAQRGIIRRRLGQNEPARADFEAALRGGSLPVFTEISLLVELDRTPKAWQRFDQAQTSGDFAGLPDVDIAYLAVRVGDDEMARTAFNRADSAGKLPNTAYQDAAFAALRSNHDAEAIMYFKRAIDDTKALKLLMDPQLLFKTRRAVADVSRQTGVVASLTYRNAISGRGSVPNAGADILQAGVEGYWRPWGYRNGRYAEVFARAFETLYSKGGGATGRQTLQSAVGIRYKPLSEANLVASISRVFRPAGASDDWLAQMGYSGDSGSDLRVDVESWWTTRTFAEVGRYFSAREQYALARVEAGRSFKVSGEKSRWVLFPHLSAAADFDSSLGQRSAFGIGPGLGARLWFREDVYAAPRSYLDVTMGYRGRLSGAKRAKGLFVTTTLSY